MKIIISLCLALAVVVLAQEDKYDSRYDNFDVASVLSNERLLKSYINCLLDKGPCTPEGKGIKERLPEALATNCKKCTEDQKILGKKVASEVLKSHPEVWKQLAAKYDPEGKYRVSFQEYLKS